MPKCCSFLRFEQLWVLRKIKIPHEDRCLKMMNFGTSPPRKECAISAAVAATRRVCRCRAPGTSLRRGGAALSPPPPHRAGGTPPSPRSNSQVSLVFILNPPMLLMLPSWNQVSAPETISFSAELMVGFLYTSSLKQQVFSPKTKQPWLWLAKWCSFSIACRREIMACLYVCHAYDSAKPWHHMGFLCTLVLTPH